MLDSSALTPSEQLQMLSVSIKEEAIKFELLRQEIAKVIVGQDAMVKNLLLALLADGHVLLEGVPGLAKTLAIKTLSQAVSADFSRIQFTPDLLPADVTGTMIYQQKSEQFTVKKGPIFANFVLADEINRAPAKVQSALLEAMQERQITIGDTTYPLPKPFLVMATQNPIEQEGTYPLPEAQVDRFMLKVSMGYPSKQEEQLILRSNVRAEGLATVSPCIHPDDIIKGKHLARSIYLDERALFWFTDIKQDIQWYIKDTADGLTWIIFLSAWYCRERKRSHFWSNFILAFLIFRVIDLTLYWANHRHAGPLYLVSYLSIIVYGSIMYGKYRK